MIPGCIQTHNDALVVHLHLSYEDQAGFLRQHQTLPRVHHLPENTTIIHRQTTATTAREEAQVIALPTTTPVEVAAPVAQVIPDHLQAAVAPEADQVLVHQVEEAANTT